MNPDMAMATAQAQIKLRSCVDVQAIQKVIGAWPSDTNMANKEPSCGKTMYPDMVSGSSLGLYVIMAPGRKVGPSYLPDS